MKIDPHNPAQGIKLAVLSGFIMLLLTIVLGIATELCFGYCYTVIGIMLFLLSCVAGMGVIVVPLFILAFYNIID